MYRAQSSNIGLWLPAAFFGLGYFIHYGKAYHNRYFLFHFTGFARPTM